MNLCALLFGCCLFATPGGAAIRSARPPEGRLLFLSWVCAVFLLVVSCCVCVVLLFVWCALLVVAGCCLWCSVV